MATYEVKPGGPTLLKGDRNNPKKPKESTPKKPKESTPKKPIEDFVALPSSLYYKDDDGKYKRFPPKILNTLGKIRRDTLKSGNTPEEYKRSGGDTKKSHYDKLKGKHKATLKGK